jgi:hypothetical protein
MKNKGLLINLGLVLIIITSAIILAFNRLVLPCGSWAFLPIWILSFILFPVSLFYFLKRNKKVEYSKSFWVIVLSLALYYYSFNESNKIAKKDIENNGGVVKVAVIYNRYSNVNTPGTIYINYEVENEIKSAQYVCGKEIYKSLSKGDTILIIYSLRCSDWNLPFNYFPSPKEINQCKEGCLLKNGELSGFE